MVRNSVRITKQFLNAAGTPSTDSVLPPASMIH